MASSSTRHPDIIIEEDQSILAIRDFKHEPDEFVPESPLSLPLALRAPGKKLAKTSDKEKKFRCPFRTEDNRVCNDSNDRLNEVLCHFYARHFARSLDNEKDSKVFTPMHCFYRSCSKTFTFHSMLVKHMHKHEGGRQNLWFINYLYENLKMNNDLKISDLKALHKADIKDFQEKVEKEGDTNRKLKEENELQIDDQKKLYEKYRKSNEQLLKENQDLRQLRNQQASMVTLDKYNELLQLYKVEKERVEVHWGMFEAEKGKAKAEKRRADTEKKRADLLEESYEYWEEGSSKRKREYKEEH